MRKAGAGETNNEKPRTLGGSATKHRIQWLLACIGLTCSFATFAQAPSVWASASPSTVIAGTERTTLAWGSSGATRCEAYGSAFPKSGSMPAGPYPVGTHTLRFSCTGATGTTYKSIVVTAINPPPKPVVTSFSLVPARASLTDPIQLRWSSVNASSCRTSNGASQSPNGSTTYPAGTLQPGSYSFWLSCTGSGGVSEKSYANITITAPPPPPNLRAFEVFPSQATTEDRIRLSWNSDHADSCELSNGRTFSHSGTSYLEPGSLSVGNHTFSMRCVGPGGNSNTLNARTTISLPAVPIPATPNVIATDKVQPAVNEYFTLSWAPVSGATSYQLHLNGTSINVASAQHTTRRSISGVVTYRVSACNASGCSA